jgi:peroxiredoxin
MINVKRLARFLLVEILLWLILSNMPLADVQAQTIYCSFSPTSENLTGSGYETLTYNVYYNGADIGDALKWFKIEKISGGQETQVVGAESSGWSTSNQTSSSVEFSGNTLSVYGTAAFNIQLAIPPVEETVREVWNMQTSFSANGSDPQYCTINSQKDSEIWVYQAEPDRPYISGISVAASATSAQISWNTNITATSVVNYGTDSGYGSTESSTGEVTSHSITLTGLSLNTTYHYQLAGTAFGGGYGYTFDNTFSTSTSTATSTPTSAAEATATPTPTPIPIDTTPPKVLITTDLEEPFEEAPKIEGKATDNKKVTEIDYSTDGGQNWLPVDNIKGANTESATFEFIPFIFDDGNYEIQVRAIDANENTGTSKIHTLVIDRLPPRVGGNLLSLGPHPLLPNEDGVVITMAGVEQKITLSAVGGPTSIDLLANEKVFSLIHSSETGLWSGVINFEVPGVYQLKAKAIDGAGNKTERNINTVVVVRSGEVTDANSKEPVVDGEVKLFYRDPQSRLWTPWEAKSFGQENPQGLDEVGHYEYFLPPGTYYLQIRAPGYARLTSQIFSVTKSTPFNADFDLTPAKKIKIGLLNISLPDFRGQEVKVKISAPEIPSQTNLSSLIGKKPPLATLPTSSGEEVSLASFQGQIFVLTFMSTWSPQSVEQVLVMDEPIYDREIPGRLVAIQESPSKLSIFTKRGNYKTPIAVDRDGDLVDQYNITTLPTHFFLGKEGMIEKVITGVLNEEEIERILAEIR